MENVMIRINTTSKPLESGHPIQKQEPGFSHSEAFFYLTGHVGGTSLDSRFELARAKPDSLMAQHGLEMRGEDLAHKLKMAETASFTSDHKTANQIASNILSGRQSILIPGDVVVEIKIGERPVSYFPANDLLVQTELLDGEDPRSPATMKLMSLKVPHAHTARNYLMPKGFTEEIGVSLQGSISFENGHLPAKSWDVEEVLPGSKTVLKSVDPATQEQVSITIHGMNSDVHRQVARPVLYSRDNSSSSCWERTASVAPGFTNIEPGSERGQLPDYVNEALYHLGGAFKDVTTHINQDRIGIGRRDSHDIWVVYDFSAKQTRLIFDSEKRVDIPLDRLYEFFPLASTPQNVGDSAAVINLGVDRHADPITGPLKLLNFLLDEDSRRKKSG